MQEMLLSMAVKQRLSALTRPLIDRYSKKYSVACEKMQEMTNKTDTV